MHKVFCAWGALVTACLAYAPAAAAQIANLPPDIPGKIAARGPVLTPDLVRDTDGAVPPLALPKASLDGIKVTADVSYGSDPAQQA